MPNVLTENMMTRIRSQILHQARTGTKMWEWFRANGLIENIGEGLRKNTTTIFKKPQGGEMGAGIHDVPTYRPEFQEVKVNLMYLTKLVQLSMDDVDAARKGGAIGGMNLIQEAIAEQMATMLQQIDQFLAWGDEMRTQLVGDVINSQAEFVGLFNGGTQLQGGIGKDDDMQTAGDFLATGHNHKNALDAAGFPPPYTMFTDQTTELYSKLENQFYSTVGITEKQRVLEETTGTGVKGAKLPVIQQWIDSYNFLDKSAAKFRMVTTNPFSNKTVNGKRLTGYKLIQGYPLSAKPYHNGGLSNGYYEILIVWSGAIEERDSTSIQRTGTLTLT